MPTDPGPRGCHGTTKTGKPCGASPLKGTTRCGAHPEDPASARFGSPAQASRAGKLGGRPPLPRPTEVARKLIEENVTAILRPHFLAIGIELHADGTTTRLEGGATMFGESKEGEIVASQYEDLGAQIQAAEKLLDRVYGRPKQQTELVGEGGGPIEFVPVKRQAGDVVSILQGTGAVKGG
jgi:hypothetical protein